MGENLHVIEMSRNHILGSDNLIWYFFQKKKTLVGNYQSHAIAFTNIITKSYVESDKKLSLQYIVLRYNKSTTIYLATMRYAIISQCGF